MTSNEHEAARGLLAAVALDAVTGDEQLLVDTHVAECAECRHELRELASMRDLLAVSVVQTAPPASLRASLLAAVAADASEGVSAYATVSAAMSLGTLQDSNTRRSDADDVTPGVGDLSATRARRARRGTFGAGAGVGRDGGVGRDSGVGFGSGDGWFQRLAPGFALAGCAASVVLAIAVVNQRGDISSMHQQLSAASSSVRHGGGSAGGDGGGATTPVSSTMFDGAHVSDVKLMESAAAPQLHGQLVMKDGAGVLVLKGLPAAPAGKSWRAWRVAIDHSMTQYAVTGGGSTRSAGGTAPDAAAMTVIPVGAVDATNADEVFLTLEPASMPMSGTHPGGHMVAVATV